MTVHKDAASRNMDGLVCMNLFARCDAPARHMSVLVGGKLKLAESDRFIRLDIAFVFWHWLLSS